MPTIHTCLGVLVGTAVAIANPLPRVRPPDRLYHGPSERGTLAELSEPFDLARCLVENLGNAVREVVGFFGARAVAHALSDSRKEIHRGPLNRGCAMPLGTLGKAGELFHGPCHALVVGSQYLLALCRDRELAALPAAVLLSDQALVGEHRQRRVDHARARRILTARTLLDRLDQVVAMARFLRDELEQQQAQRGTPKQPPSPASPAAWPPWASWSATAKGTAAAERAIGPEWSATAPCCPPHPSPSRPHGLLCRH